MSSLSGQQFNTKTMTGISDAYSNNIICDDLEVTTNLTVDNGGIVILPSNSINDTALSSNVPLKNTSNTFTNTNFFTNNMTLTNQKILTIKGTTENGSIKYIDTSSILEISNNTNAGNVYIRSLDTFGTLQSIIAFYHNGISIFKGIFLANTAINGINKLVFNDTTQQLTAYPGSSNFALLNANNIFTGTTNTFPTPATIDNSTTVSTTAFVKNQSYITATALTPYALLATSNAFLGLANTFPTPATATSSTIVATTAFVKAQLYSPLAGNNTFTGICTFNNANTYINQLSMPSAASKLFTVSSAGLVGAVQLSIPDATTPVFQVNSVGNIMYCKNIYIPNSTSPLCTITSLGGISCSNFSSTTNIAIPDSTTPVFRTNSAGQIDYCNSIYIPNTTTPTITLPNNGYITCVSIAGNTTTQTLGDNSLKLASTAFVQSAIPALTNYALLNNGTSSQTFTGNNTFTNNGSIDPISITSSAMLYSTAKLAFNYTAGTYSSITQANDFLVCANNSVSGLGAVSICAATTTGGNVSGIRVDQNSVTIGSDYGIICNSKIKTNYNTLTYSAPTNLEIGFVMYGVAFATWLTTTSTNIWSVTWDNTGDKLWGTFLVEIFIITTGSGTLLISASFNEIGTTTFLSDKMCNGTGTSNLPSPYLGLKTCSMSFTLSIHSTTTYYLNTYISSAGSNVAQTGSSYIKFTRIG